MVLTQPLLKNTRDAARPSLEWGPEDMALYLRCRAWEDLDPLGERIRWPGLDWVGSSY